MISKNEAVAEERRDFISDAVNASSAAQSLRESIANEGQALVSPSAAQGVVVNSETGEAARALRYGDKYHADSVYGI